MMGGYLLSSVKKNNRIYFLKMFFNANQFFLMPIKTLTHILLLPFFVGFESSPIRPRPSTKWTSKDMQRLIKTAFATSSFSSWLILHLHLISFHISTSIYISIYCRSNASCFKACSLVRRNIQPLVWHGPPPMSLMALLVRTSGQFCETGHRAGTLHHYMHQSGVTGANTAN